jgi:Ca-activated chloride channel family protein
VDGVFPDIDFGTIRFGEPVYLWALIVPTALSITCAWQVTRRWRDSRRFRERRQLPVGEQFGVFGGLLFWFFLILSSAMVIVALARPQAAASLVRTAGLDIVILQDGSASMYIRDVNPDRWQRSMKFLRNFAESLEWKDDRIAMAVFAHVAAPQVRLTTDPNTFYFFLDHLSHESPFRLQDDPTWDTNIELGVYWGIRLIEKDEELRGRSPNVKMFVLISDGQAWSGTIERSLRLAHSRDIPVFVIGVGTAAGAFIPEASSASDGAASASTFSPLRGVLDRASLLTIATAGGGQYYELDRDSDRQIATAIIDAGRRRAGALGVQETLQDLYWYCLFGAACLICPSMLFLQEKGELWLTTAGASLALIVVWTLMR